MVAVGVDVGVVPFETYESVNAVPQFRREPEERALGLLVDFTAGFGGGSQRFRHIGVSLASVRFCKRHLSCAQCGSCNLCARELSSIRLTPEPTPSSSLVLGMVQEVRRSSERKQRKS